MSEPQPIFFIGAPRSGTTITFEQFASHPDLAWISNYSRAFPNFQPINLVRRVFDNPLFQIRGKKNQFGDAPFLNKYLPRPDESYEFWNTHGCVDFDLNYLLGETASEKERNALRNSLAKLQRYQGKSRVTAKLTGPGRIGYLNSVWPEMRVVHVIRNGLDVVRSLLNVPFWEKGGGFERPWWKGGLNPEELARWEDSGKDPAALAALQWRTIIERTREEAHELLGDRYVELRYESFLEDSKDQLESIYDSVGLDVELSELEVLEARNKNYGDNWNSEERRVLQSWMDPVFTDLGYGER